MNTMPHLNTENLARQEAARQNDGRFGEQHRSGPAGVLGEEVSLDETVYTVKVDGAIAYVGGAGDGLTPALHEARVLANRLTHPSRPRPEIEISSAAAGDPSRGVASFSLVGDGVGRVVGDFNGNNVAVEDLDERGLSLSQLSELDVDPYLVLDDDEGELEGVREALPAGINYLGVYARCNEDGTRDIAVDLTETFLWDAEAFTIGLGDDAVSALTGSTPAERYEAWLTEHRGTVEEVFREWFDADIDVPDSWESANVTLHVTVPYERFTERLVTEDCWAAVAKFQNETDPGTYGARYVMDEVRRRVAAQAE